MNQVEEFKPPPNPAKVTDSRFNGYMIQYGSQSWELDALDPKVLSGLVETEVTKLIDTDIWNSRLELQVNHRATLKKLAENWDQ